MAMQIFNTRMGKAGLIPLFGLGLVALLTACGGSSNSSNPPAPPPAPTAPTPGYYAGTSATAEQVMALILPDGTFNLVAYSPDSQAGVTAPQLAIFGNATTPQGILTINGRRFAFPKAIPSDLGLISGLGTWGTNALNFTLSDTVNFGGGQLETSSYSLAYSPINTGVASLGTVAGHYSAPLQIQDTGSGVQADTTLGFTVDGTTGNLTGTFASSSPSSSVPSIVTGKLTPRTDANCYDMTFTVASPVGITNNSTLDGMTFTGKASFVAGPNALLFPGLSGDPLAKGVLPVIFIGAKS